VVTSGLEPELVPSATSGVACAAFGMFSVANWLPVGLRVVMLSSGPSARTRNLGDGAVAGRAVSGGAPKLMRHYYSVEAIREAEAPLLAGLPDGALMRRAAYGLATAIIGANFATQRFRNQPKVAVARPMSTLL
jgi:hypothetical protein